ncbi:DUF4263 domain-containing protein [candidate division WWE3 bacterium]|nr:DUF4263 domain-containing protein [candidate division WWE3 bacterium]
MPISDEHNWMPVNYIPDIRQFEPIPLPNSDGQSSTRKVVKAEFIDPNPQNPNAPLRLSIVHQRRKADGTFEDCDHFNLRQLPAGQEVRMKLNSEQTLALQAILDRLFEYCRNNLGMNGAVPTFTLERADEVVRVPQGRQAIIQGLLHGNYSDDFWSELAEISPESANRLSYGRIQELRQLAFDQFGQHINASDWSEPMWQDFFEANEWIFGYGLSYKWLHRIGHTFEQPTTGHTVVGAGRRPDGFTQVAAEIATTVFVEIKKPDTTLLNTTEYRSGIYRPSDELAGGVAQMQATIQDWVGVQHREVFRPTDEDGFDQEKPIYSYQPKGILVVGSLNQFHDGRRHNQNKIRSFELLRRHTTNPEIITFDELLHRAQNIITNTVVSPEPDPVLTQPF